MCLWLIASVCTRVVSSLSSRTQIKPLACVTRYDLELAVEYDAEISRAGGYEPVRETHLSLLRCHFILKNAIILLRQARDRHREGSAQKER